LLFIDLDRKFSIQRKSEVRFKNACLKIAWTYLDPKKKKWYGIWDLQHWHEL
jgi:hypothetical protein